MVQHADTLDQIKGLLQAGDVAQAAQEETVRRTLQWPAGSTGQVFELSNINGAVHIVAEQRSDVSVVSTLARVATSLARRSLPPATPA